MISIAVFAVWPATDTVALTAVVATVPTVEMTMQLVCVRSQRITPSLRTHFIVSLLTVFNGGLR